MFVNINQNLTAFNRAHRTLLDQRGQPKAGEHQRLLEEWWQEEYGVEIVRTGNGMWKDLFFKTEAEATMFLLRWA